MSDCGLKCFLRLCTAALFVAAINLPTTLSAKETITWVEVDWPPIWIVSGPDKGKGLLDGLISIYERNLPEYEHVHVTANITKILAMMKEGQNVCHAGILKSPGRDDFMVFSIPNTITNVHRIVVKKERQSALFGDQKSVSLDALLGNASLRLGLSRDSSYGATLDETLAKHKGQSNVFSRSGQDNHQGLLRMLKEERIDYMIGYPWELDYIATQADLRLEIGVVDIKELEKQQWLVSYVGCTKNDWGRQVIAKMNGILSRVRPTDEYVYHLFRWHPAGTRPAAMKVYAERVLNVTQ